MEYSPIELFQQFLNIVAAGLRSWGGLHPAIVHFPIVLLLLVPVFLILALFLPRSTKLFMNAALVFSVAGTLAIFAAVSTGEQASEAIGYNPVIHDTFEHHEHLAMFSRTAFVVFSILLAAFTILPRLLKKELSRNLQVGGSVVLLSFYLYGALLILNTADAGGQLVHRYGIHSTLYQGPESGEHSHAHE